MHVPDAVALTVCLAIAFCSPANAEVLCPQDDLIEFSVAKGSSSRTVSLPRSFLTYKDVVPGSTRVSFTTSVSIKNYVELGAIRPSEQSIGGDALQVITQNLPSNSWTFERFLEFHFRSDNPNEPIRLREVEYGLISATGGTELHYSKLYTDEHRDVFIICTDLWSNGKGFCVQNEHGKFLSVRLYYDQELLGYWKVFKRLFRDYEACILQ